MRIVLREHDLSDSRDAAIEVDIDQVFVHPEYTGDQPIISKQLYNLLKYIPTPYILPYPLPFSVYGNFNDLALLRLAERIGSGESWVRPACMPDQGVEPPTGDLCTVAGWGSGTDTDIKKISRK